MQHSHPYYPQNQYHAYQAAPNPYYAPPRPQAPHRAPHSAYRRHPAYQHYAYPPPPVPNRNVAGEGLRNVIQSEWSAQFGPTLVFLLIAGALLWFKVYGGAIVGDRAQTELLQTGMVAGAVVLVLSIAVNILAQSASLSAQDMIWIHMALVLITCVLLWNHVAHIVAINAKPPPEDDLRSSSSRSSSSKSSSSSSSSSSRSRSSSSRDPSSSSSSLRPPSSSSSSSSSSSRPSSSSSSSSRPSSSSSSSSSALLASSSSRSGSSSSRSSSSRDKEPAKEERDEDPDPWGKAHPSSKLTRPQPRLWPFPIGLANPASRDKDGKERVWWEGGEPHQVGYIGGAEGSSGGAGPTDEGALAGASSSSRDVSVPSSSSSSATSITPKPTREEVDNVKAIMKGTKKLSEDKDKRARQKELIKLMSAKKGDDPAVASSQSLDPAVPSSRSRDAPASSASIKPPTPEELAEVKAIMKGKAELSTEKDKRARQKELMKLIMAKPTSGDPLSGVSSSAPGALTEPPTADELTVLQDILAGKAELSTDKAKHARQKELIKMITGGGGGGGGKDEPATKKGVSFADEPLGPTGSGDPGKPSTGRSVSGGLKPESKSRPSSSAGPMSGAGDPPIPGLPSSSGPNAGGASEEEELDRKRKKMKYMKMITVVAAVSVLNYHIGFLTILGFLLFMLEEYTSVNDPSASAPKDMPSVPKPTPSSSSSAKPSSSSSPSSRPSSSSSSSSRPSSSSSSSSSSARRTVTEEEKAALPTSLKRKDDSAQPLPPISRMYISQPDIKTPKIWRGPDFKMNMQGSTSALLGSVYGP